MSDSGDDREEMNAPPPPSQSHFAKFENFKPDDDASFEHEFARLASSQQWVPGSQQYKTERTIAIREEIKTHYFSQSQSQEVTEADKLQGYQDLCDEVGIPASDSIEQCQKRLKRTLVNIVDLINARRTHEEVVVWHDFEAFRAYTLEPENRIDKEEAKKDGGYLASLLQYLRGPRRRGPRCRGPGGAARRVVSGRVTKSAAQGWV